MAHKPHLRPTSQQLQASNHCKTQIRGLITAAGGCKIYKRLPNLQPSTDRLVKEKEKKTAKNPKVASSSFKKENF